MKDLDQIAGRLKATTYELCLPEGRKVATPGHDVARVYLQKRLAEVGCEPYCGEHFELSYERNDTHFTNLIGVIPGRDRSLPPLLVGAHYDSVISAPSADDNGAAVAIALEVARQVKERGGFARDVVIALFDAEEPPYFLTPSMGSRRFVADQADGRGFCFALIYDLVGHDLVLPEGGIFGNESLDLSFLKGTVFMTGAESHSQLPEIVKGCRLPEGLGMIATLNQYIGDMSDHGAFRESGVPYLFFSCGRWEHYHMPTDTPDRLNYLKMARLTLLSLEILERAAAAGFQNPSLPSDPVEFEIGTFRETFKDFYPLLLASMGMKEIRSRDDLDRIANELIGLGL